MFGQILKLLALLSLLWTVLTCIMWNTSLDDKIQKVQDRIKGLKDNNQNFKGLRLPGSQEENNESSNQFTYFEIQEKVPEIREEVQESTKQLINNVESQLKLPDAVQKKMTSLMSQRLKIEKVVNLKKRSPQNCTFYQHRHFPMCHEALINL